METPRTPKKRRNAHTRAVVSSPYFRVSASATAGSSGATSRHSSSSPERQCTLDDQDLPTFGPTFKSAEQLPLPSKDHPVQVAFDSRSPDSDDLHQQLALLKPPLIQERIANDPWKILIAVTLLNKTAGKQAIPIFWQILESYPTAFHLSQANENDLTNILRPLGLHSIRAKRLINQSKAYLQDPPSPFDLRTSKVSPTKSSRVSPSKSSKTSPSISSKASSESSKPKFRRGRYPPTPISHLPGTGPYALDSYRIFCTADCHTNGDEWKDVMPTDKELIRYLKWKWAFEERKAWMPGIGVIGDVDVCYLEKLVDDLAASTPTPS